MSRFSALLLACLLWPNAVSAGDRPPAMEGLIARELELTKRAIGLHQARSRLEREQQSLEYAIEGTRHHIGELQRRSRAYRKVRLQRSRQAKERARKLYRLLRGGAAQLMMESLRDEQKPARQRVLEGRTLHRLVRQDRRELAVFHRAEVEVKEESQSLAREQSALMALSMIHRLQETVLRASQVELQPVLARSEKARRSRERRSTEPLSPDSMRPLMRAKRALKREEGASKKKSLWPTRLERPVVGAIVGRFGAYEDPILHVPMERKGLELRAKRGESVRAVASGKVAFVGYLSGFEDVVVIDHGDGHLSMTGRLWGVVVNEGDAIEGGAVLGRVATKVRRDGLGRTVYLELRHGERAIDPRPLLGVH